MIVDGIVIAVLLVSAIISFLRGFIRETLTILGVAGGLGAAYFGGPVLSPIFRHWLDVKEGEPPHKLFDVIPYSILADVLSYGAIFIVVVIALSIVSHLLAESARAVGLGALDRTLGVIFGLVRGALLLGILYLPVYIGVDKDTKAKWFEGSKTDVYLEAISGKISDMIPESAMKGIQNTQKTAEDSGMKEQLQKIDLLKGDNGAASSTTPQTAPGAAQQGGYSEEFRKKMNQMFQQDGTATPGPTQMQTVPAAPVQPAAPSSAPAPQEAPHE